MLDRSLVPVVVPSVMVRLPYHGHLRAESPILRLPWDPLAVRLEMGDTAWEDVDPMEDLGDVEAALLGSRDP